VQWCREKGGTVDDSDLVYKISRIGAGGKHAKNCERDFHTLLKSFSRRFGAKINTVKTRMYNHEKAVVEWQDVHVIYPDDMAAALYNKGDRVWRHTMFGGHSPDDVRTFWQHCKEHCDWFKGSACCDFSPLEKLIPMSIYGDDIHAYKGSETGAITVIGWTSDLAYRNNSLTRYWPIVAYPEYAATDWTYNDIMGPVVERMQSMVDPDTIHDWSADGSMFVMSSLQGDLKFIKDQYKLHNYRANSFCSSCGAQKKHANVSMTLADFRPDAAHAASLPDLSEFHQNRVLAAKRLFFYFPFDWISLFVAGGI